MNPNPNPLLENSAFGSKWLNPDYLFARGVEFFQNLFDAGASDTLATTENIFDRLLFFLCLFFITLILYCAIRLREIRKKEHEYLAHELAEYAHHQKEREKKKQEGEGVSKNERWLKTLSHLFSQHPSDWKLAVIEADSMLEVLMGDLGFKGESLGERLKNADQNTFRGLSSAWEAHTVRNRIAHEGTSFNLTQHEAKRIIAIYEQIFRGYGYI